MIQPNKPQSFGDGILCLAAACCLPECGKECRFPRAACMKRKILNYFNALERKAQDQLKAQAIDESEGIRVFQSRFDTFPGLIGTMAGTIKDKKTQDNIYRGQLLRFTAKHMRKYGAL
jgi:hypothetical protein